MGATINLTCSRRDRGFREETLYGLLVSVPWASPRAFVAYSDSRRRRKPIASFLLLERADRRT